MREIQDGRWRGEAPRLAPDGMKTVSRVKAAELAGVDPRTITRWAAHGKLVRYIGPRGDVQFSVEAVVKLRKDPDDRQKRSVPAVTPGIHHETPPPKHNRW
jgi:hypothetical protein